MNYSIVDYDQLTLFERDVLYGQKEESTVHEDRVEEFVDNVVVDVNFEVAVAVEQAATEFFKELLDEIQWLDEDLQYLEDELNETEDFYERKLDDAEARIAELEREADYAADAEWLRDEIEYLQEDLAQAQDVIRDLEDENGALLDEIDDLRAGPTERWLS